ncbi:MAG: DUF4363 family protein [Clostridia bacterium]|nr:DUF4363 family protein [Clostridia bacterium]
MGTHVANIIAIVMAFLILIASFIIPHALIDDLYFDGTSMLEAMEEAVKAGDTESAIDIAKTVYDLIEKRMKSLRIFVDQDTILELEAKAVATIIFAEQKNVDLLLGAIHELKSDIEALNEQENPTFATIL